ncbi:DNA-binding response regulator [Paenibacillus sp. UMB4589-SE434]|uniref:DNA-binding response regulator n=1 Tax=Paenibacillus sp. UMB4589-SE434 TaxID=3046314 RepID=UPI00254D0915|nr:DNA-binding response regulator [Paenibacillus sp. UMB4589-SE434]MDK8182254.1 DNA-binding response regulator [Paenibacillus sp. UMB4589-SE434]
MTYESMYEKWFADALEKSSGNRKMRLMQGHGYAEQLFLEKAWYPAFKSLEHLYPEYEVEDYRDGSRFLDFAYIRFPLRLAIEIDGYGPHHAKVTRWQFSDSLIRQNHLIIDGWRILRFSYDDIHDKPRMCEQLLQQFMGTWYQGYDTGHSSSHEVLENEILHYAAHLDRDLLPQDVCHFLNVGKEKARSLLKRMVVKQMLLPHKGGKMRIRSYTVNRNYMEKRRDLFL